MIVIYFLSFLIVSATASDFDNPNEVFVVVGSTENLLCQANEKVVWWTKDNQNITLEDKRFSWNTTENSPNDDDNELKLTKQHTFSHTLTLINVTKEYSGNYLCHFPENENEKDVTSQVSHVVVAVQIPIIRSPSYEEIKLKEKDAKSFSLNCIVEAFPTNLFNRSIKWEKETVDNFENKDASDSSEINTILANKTEIITNDTHIIAQVTIDKATKKHNGTYICSVLQPSILDKPFEEKIEKRTSILIQSAPIIDITFAKAIGRNRIFLNWTVTDNGNSKIIAILPQYKAENEQNFQYTPNRVEGNTTSMVIDKLSNNTKYKLKISARNEIGSGPVTEWAPLVQTLLEDPVFVPVVEVKGNSHSTITIGWQPPPPDLLDYIHYYEVEVYQQNYTNVEKAFHAQNSRNLPYMASELLTATEYFFKVRACSEYNKECGNWSEVVNGTTMDGSSGPPDEVKVTCMHHNISKRNFVHVEWTKPSKANGIVMSYQVLLEGLAHFKSDQGLYINQTYGPKAKNIDKSQDTKATYENVPPNTNFTVSVAAVTRSKKPGDKRYANCTMPPTVPDQIGKTIFGKHLTEEYNWVFKLFLPRVSERNGKICCYRIYMIKINNHFNIEQQPDDLDIITYNEAHNDNSSAFGAYIADIISSNHYKSEVLLGSGKHHVYSKSSFSNKCSGCLLNITRKKAHAVIDSIDINNNAAAEDDDKIDESEVESKNDSTNDEIKGEKIEFKDNPSRRKRHDQFEPKQLNILSLNHAAEKSSENVDLYDGPLDIQSNYTGFIEVVVENEDMDDKTLSIYSDFFSPLSPKPPVPSETIENNDMLMAITYLLAGLIVLVISLFFLLCLLHRYQKKHIMQGNEVVSLTDSLRLLCHGGRANHHQHRSLNTVSKPPDLPPIQKNDLPQSYADRHKDSDYGFQHEFEMLPDRFTDRTSRSGDMKENIYKNRYPDIKAYDQTRVKLSPVNGIIGSDYINANFVIGYKERKKFICAQGPMDSTVNDFWRMVYEQHLEIIIMLTNLEEYNKTKCAKYWPERISETVQFGDITVHFDSEQRYSDYLVRNLKIIKRNANSDMESNSDEPSRHITQYHYLVWKDFQAPEHPYGILKFIKTINSDYSVQRGPLLIHCSAGVGRTGTLVALDSLIQQLNEENQASIFNTICDMRHQRNYLVQSLKQYIFLYRALLDVAHFGDTELRYKGLAPAVESLKQRSSDSKEQSKLEQQYEKIRSIQDDIKKTCAVGSGDENLVKNRSDEVIPFDRNRVILTPIPGRDHSTYINASFIEGYDNHESFIIAQDPLESTIADFWRMVSEQSIPTIVMMSEIGTTENKCPRYWADDEIQYDHILVKYVQSESCPYYTKREFSVTNCKINDTINVTHFQYNGWPTVDGEVPEVTRGILEIVHQSQNHHQLRIEEDNTPKPMLVHCCKGTDRSSIFVAMCILVQQLRLEKRVDIRVITQKLRTQRAQMIDSVNAYEFLHRALVDFANLHKSSFENSPS